MKDVKSEASLLLKAPMKISPLDDFIKPLNGQTKCIIKMLKDIFHTAAGSNVCSCCDVFPFVRENGLFQYVNTEFVKYMQEEGALVQCLVCRNI